MSQNPFLFLRIWWVEVNGPIWYIIPMVKATAVVTNSNGIHVRPSRVIASALACSSAHISLSANGFTVTSMNMMNLLSLGLKQDDTVEITVDGEGEQQVLAQAIALFETRFDFPPASNGQ